LLLRALFPPLAARLGGRLVQADGEAFVIEGGLPDTGRHFRLRAQVDDESGLGGEVVGEVAVDNRVGYLHLVHLLADDEPRDFLAPLQGELWVSHFDPEMRAEMKQVAARMPADFLPAIERFLRTHEHYALELLGNRFQFTIGWFGDEEWDDCARHLGAQLRELDLLATIVEAVGRPTDVHCRWCGRDFALTAERRCPHCGGAIG